MEVDVTPSLVLTEMLLKYWHHQLTILAKSFSAKKIAFPAKCPQASTICVEQLHPVDR